MLRGSRQGRRTWPSGSNERIELLIDPPPGPADRGHRQGHAATAKSADDRGAIGTAGVARPGRDAAADADAQAAARQGRRQPVQAPRESLHQRRVRPRVVRRRRNADGARDPRQGAADAQLPEGPGVADRRVGEPARQPERRLGAVRDGRMPWRRTGSTATRCGRTRPVPTRCYDSARAISKLQRPGHPARVARRPRLGDEWVPGRRRPARVRQREGQRCLRPRPWYPSYLVDLGLLRPARHVPGRA